MSWFQSLTGFPERSSDDTRRRLQVVGSRLHSTANGRSWAIGRFELASLADLRTRTAAIPAGEGRLRCTLVQGESRELHSQPAFAGALFQAASQFNALEMPGPDVTPEQGVTGYEHDHTQGPACALACGAGTIYRNDFVPVGDGVGQSRQRQLDGLADLGAALAACTGLPVASLWEMRNGYALCSRQGLEAIAAHLATLHEPGLDALRALLRIGLHWNVEVTDLSTPDAPGPTVSQAYCSALPVAYAGVRTTAWAPFARLVLEAAYEATLLAGVLNAAQGGTATVLLTRVGGGVFGNEPEWIDAAIRRALTLCEGRPLDVRLVSYGTPGEPLRRLAAEFAL